MEHVRLRLLTASALTLFIAARSQVPTPEVQSGAPLSPQFGSSGIDNAEKVVLSKDLSAVFVTGETKGGYASGNKLYLRRYSRNGSLKWVAEIGSNSSVNRLEGLALDSYNRIYVARTVFDDQRDTGNAATAVDDRFLERYTETGKLVWSRKVETFGAGFTDVSSVTTDKSGNVFIAGRKTDPLKSLTFISKYSPSGNVVWTKRYEDAYFSQIQTDESGNLYVLNYSDGVRKYTGSGRFVWEQDISRNTNIALQGIHVGKEAVYANGNKYWYPDNDIGLEQDAYIIKLDLSGRRKWAKSFGTKRIDLAFAVTSDSHGDIYVTGSTEGALAGKNSGYGDVFVRKYKSSGDTVWTQQFGSGEGETGLSVAAFASDELYVVGEANGDLGAGNQGGDPPKDAFLARLNSNGNRVWIR